MRRRRWRRARFLLRYCPTLLSEDPTLFDVVTTPRLSLLQELLGKGKGGPAVHLMEVLADCCKLVYSDGRARSLHEFEDRVRRMLGKKHSL